MIPDGELLRRYVEDGLEAAFTELVQRHFNVVYYAALRRVGGNAHAADDVVQKVFSDLAQKARALQNRPNLAGWLYTGARFAAADVVRAEQRRRTYEEKAHHMNELNSPPPSAAIQLEPVLDEVMDRLDEPDRDAVLLYFFEGRSFAEIGSVLSLSADATRMRVNRALERLRTALAQRGIVSTAAALGTALAGQSALAAPAPLALAVAREALAQVGAVPTSVSIATRLIQGAKTVQFVSCAAGVAALVIFALVRPSGSQEDAETPAPVVTTKFVDPVSEAANIPSTSAAATVAEVSPPAVQPAQPATAAPRLPSAPTRGEFGNLSPAERALLARLWYQHETVAPPPGIGVGLRFSPDAAIIDGFDPLIARGWAATGSQAGIHLTPAGVAFCEAHRDEIDSSPAFRRLANVKARP